MGSLLTELGKRLAERWISLLVLPGTLYLAAATVAHTLGHRHALDVGRLTDRITVWAQTSVATTLGGQAVLLAAVLAGSATAGIVAQGIGSLVERLHLAADWYTWPPVLRRLAHRLTVRRQRLWRAAASDWHRHREEAALVRTRGERLDPAQRRAAYAAMTRVAPEYPDRPSWSGDRIHAVAVRMDRDHHLDFAAAWPHIWLLLPEENRVEINASRQALARAMVLAAWALLYLPLTIWWWPAAAVTATLTLTSWRRTRTATDTYATLLEAATRVHARDLADRLGLDATGPLTAEAGDALTRLLVPSTPRLP
ncbi:hypothetical protein HTV45_03620 [Streptomyces sp. CHD11]|uniref:hypothetical protein n=1 Tax=Streptomyces sp. CHD11 TaxID=2741325 RepID=UPI001BFC672E|nr:hypothetical protein [Streptomyces sp. CHD11]MBT3150003.1 hypothetical protein [Streptomyces sp. CHD11]